ncbi:MAG: cyclase family protein, partial [Chloroflexota bacterium]
MNDYHFIDVSHVVEAGLVTYPGLPAPVIDEYMSREDSRANYAPGTEFHIGHVDMVANTGTYVDSPFHRYRQASDLASLPLHKLANLKGLVVRIPGEASNPGDQRVIDASVFLGLALSNRAVLVNTGWSRYWNSDRYFTGHPFLTEDAAIHLRDSGAALVGIDSLNIDDTNNR